MVLRGNRQGIEGNDQDHQPVEDFGLDHVMALPAKDAVPLPPVATGRGNTGGGRQRAVFLRAPPPFLELLSDRLQPVSI